MRGWVCLLAAVWLGAACSPSPPPPRGAWQPVVLGQAYTLEAPTAYLAADNTPVALWLAPQAGGGLFWLWQGGVAQTLPVPSRVARAPAIYPAPADRFHLLWLDRHDDGQTRLYSLLANRAPSIERGPPSLSDRRTEDYAAVPTTDGGLWVLWTGGPIAEPHLFRQRLDALGRPAFAEQVAYDAVHVAAIPADSGARVYWSSADGTVWRAELQGESFAPDQDILRGPALGGGDRLAEFYAATDGDTDYLFWNIERGSGQREVWWAHSADAWGAPAPLPSDTPSFWAAPANTRADLVTLALVDAEGVGVLYLRDGERIGASRVGGGDAVRAAIALYGDAALATWSSWDGEQMAAFNPSGGRPPDTR